MIQIANEEKTRFQVTADENTAEKVTRAVDKKVIETQIQALEKAAKQARYMAQEMEIEKELITTMKPLGHFLLNATQSSFHGDALWETEQKTLSYFNLYVIQQWRNHVCGHKEQRTEGTAGIMNNRVVEFLNKTDVTPLQYNSARTLRRAKKLLKRLYVEPVGLELRQIRAQDLLAIVHNPELRSDWAALIKGIVSKSAKGAKKVSVPFMKRVMHQYPLAYKEYQVGQIHTVQRGSWKENQRYREAKASIPQWTPGDQDDMGTGYFNIDDCEGAFPLVQDKGYEKVEATIELQTIISKLSAKDREFFKPLLETREVESLKGLARLKGIKIDCVSKRLKRIQRELGLAA